MRERVKTLKRLEKLQLLTVLAILVLNAALFLASCATSPYAFTKDPLSILGSGADAWIVVPVAAHRNLVERFAQAKGFSLSDEALDRTRVLYAGVYAEPLGAYAEPAGDVRVLATGSFPKGAGSVVFPKSRGWTRAGSEGGTTWYRSGVTGAAIPRSGLFALSRDMPSLLRRLSERDAAPEAVPEEFSRYLDSPELDGRVAFMTRSPGASLAGLLPAGMTLPIDHALLFARVSEGADEYILEGYLQAADERSARAVAAIVRLATGTRPRTDGARVYLNGWILRTDALAALSGL